jgi:hypothetical protein
MKYIGLNAIAEAKNRKKSFRLLPCLLLSWLNSSHLSSESLFLPSPKIAISLMHEEMLA